jgi:hypothetical protein
MVLRAGSEAGVLVLEAPPSHAAAHVYPAPWDRALRVL